MGGSDTEEDVRIELEEVCSSAGIVGDEISGASEDRD